MGKSVSEFSAFVEGDHTPRYEFDYESKTIRDTKWRRDLVANAKRGGRPYYRLVTNDDDEVRHVRAEDIFGGDVNEDVQIESDFDPRDFADRYDFDFDEGTVVHRRDKEGSKRGKPMTLLAPNGWKHFLLRHNDGHRVRVTPAEIRKWADATEWEVPPPPGCMYLAKVFPHHVFTRDGQVLRIRSTEDPLIRPEPCPVDQFPPPGTTDRDLHTVYRLRSQGGVCHLISRKSIKDVFSSSAVTLTS